MCKIVRRPRTDSSARALEARVARWLAANARRESAKAIARLRSGTIRIRKVDDDALSDKELIDILVRFGLRQIGDTGKRTAGRYGGEWIVSPALVEDVIASKEILVQRLRRDLRDTVRESIRQIMTQANREEPAPSSGEIARRIRTQFHGGLGGYHGALDDATEQGILPTQTERLRRQRTPALYAFSPERAALIARTESLQNEATGIYEGMALSGVDEIEWISSNNSNHGSRHHERMNGKRTKLGGYFATPLGNRLRYPGDPSAPIEDTANCGCMFAPVYRSKRK